jgi:hypothetical protein
LGIKFLWFSIGILTPPSPTPPPHQALVDQGGFAQALIVVLSKKNNIVTLKSEKATSDGYFYWSP